MEEGGQWKSGGSVMEEGRTVEECGGGVMEEGRT